MSTCKLVASLRLFCDKMLENIVAASAMLLSATMCLIVDVFVACTVQFFC